MTNHDKLFDKNNKLKENKEHIINRKTKRGDKN